MPGKTSAQTRGRSDAQGGKLRVRQVRSGIGRPAVHRRTLTALGLKHHQDVIVVNDSPAIRGMLYQVRHLVEVSPAGDA
jgi:large subunit ribosomal protein L30